MQYSAQRAQSLFSMDVEGRVLRTDSFSKILSAGIRVGFVSGPSPLIDRISLHNQASIMHTSGLSQLAVLTVLKHWNVGESGSTESSEKWEAHLARVCAFYSSQCDAFMAAADRHLVDPAGKPLAEYARPSAGMFVWIKLLGVADTTALIMQKAVEKKVLLVPGSAFFPGNPPTSYVRAAFSTGTGVVLGISFYLKFKNFNYPTHTHIYTTQPPPPRWTLL